MSHINRTLRQQIPIWFHKHRAIIIYGARQVGKTTLTHNILKSINEPFLYLDCDQPINREKLNNPNLEDLKLILGNHKFIFIDEAQRVPNISLTLKIIVDQLPEVQAIATGSSSFDLANQISEPLTGRKIVFHLYPISISENISPYDQIAFEQRLPQFLRYGMYPAVINVQSEIEKTEILGELASSNLYKDLLEFRNLRNPQILRDLLKALALQIGQQVSYTELSQLIGIDKNTIESYIDLLEKGLIIFRLPPYYKNKRTELKKLRKIYFYDVGIRNAILNNFNPLDTRLDVGQLWENFCIAERIKTQQYQRDSINNFFWRTYDQTEIDWVEETANQLAGYEFKWNSKRKTSAPPSWKELYPQATWQIITPQNAKNFLTSTLHSA